VTDWSTGVAGGGEMPKNTFLTKNTPNVFIFLPITMLGRLAWPFRGQRYYSKRSIPSKTNSGHAYGLE